MTGEWSIDDVKPRVDSAIQPLIKWDKTLLAIHASERSISHRLAMYLQEEFSDLSVDCEYNRHIDVKKELTFDRSFGTIQACDTDAKTVFPDIVVHARMSDECNVLVVEIKKEGNQDGTEKDRAKLIAFTKDPYNYDFGLFLMFSHEGKVQELWFHQGEEKSLDRLGYGG